MTIYYQDDQTTVYHGDCIEVMRNMPEDSVDAIVTDPPYGLSNTTPEQVAETIIKWVSGDREYLPGGVGFMGKAWDGFVPPVAVWDEAMRVLKPGGHVLSFAGTRTMDLMTLGLRLAGFEIRDSLAWLYGSGFPKSHDVSKAVDKAAGAKREVVGTKLGRPGYSLASGGDAAWGGLRNSPEGEAAITAPATDAAKQWSGWGTALKPANEPIVMARKPFKGTVAANVLEHGTGALNIDACRIETTEDIGSRPAPTKAEGWGMGGDGKHGWTPSTSGRWPANVILDEHMAGVLDEQSGVSKSPDVGSVTNTKPRHSGSMVGAFKHPEPMSNGYGDSGGASRFFYVAKAPKRERPEVNGVKHTTVKPLTLMRYLVRMVTPPNGIVLDPFAGSGTTIEAALLEGFQSIGIELTDEYLPLIQQRIQRQGVGAAMSTKYHVCDHPELLVKDETCFLCDQIDGQTDALNEVEW